MNGMDNKSFYMYLKIEKSTIKSDEYVAKLVSPILIGRDSDMYVSLCDISYDHDPYAYKNCPRAVLQVACPRYTKEAPKLSSLATPTIPFLRCELEDGEYSERTLCDALNDELKNKLPASFKGRECQFVYNPHINRIEISIDGNPNVFATYRFTLIVYHPLSKTVGLTESDEASATYCFGAPNPPLVPPKKISEESHATSAFPPYLPRPHYVKWYLNVIEQEQDVDVFNPILAVMARPPLPSAGAPIVYHFDNRQYKKINSNLTVIRELKFQIKDEHRKNFIGFNSMNITLHFVTK